MKDMPLVAALPPAFLVHTPEFKSKYFVQKIQKFKFSKIRDGDLTSRGKKKDRREK